jgi:hypothetical protein
VVHGLHELTPALEQGVEVRLEGVQSAEVLRGQGRPPAAELLQ